MKHCKVTIELPGKTIIIRTEYIKLASWVPEGVTVVGPDPFRDMDKMVCEFVFFKEDMEEEPEG